MATYETKGRLTYKDENSDNHIIYPVTKMDCIEDMPDIEKEIAESVATYLEENPVETPDITAQVERAETAANAAEEAAARAEEAAESMNSSGGNVDLTDYIELLPESSYPVEEDMGLVQVDRKLTFIAGKTYLVTWNGVNYVRVARELDEVVLLGESDDPFSVECFPNTTDIYAYDGSTSVTLAIYEKIAYATEEWVEKKLEEYSGGNVSWNDVTGKPFDEETVVVWDYPVLETDANGDAHIIYVSEDFVLHKGETYDVELNGKHYSVVCTTDENDWCILEHEDFFIKDWENDLDWEVWFSGKSFANTTISLKISQTNIKKLDSKYLPMEEIVEAVEEALPDSGGNPTIDIFPETYFGTKHGDGFYWDSGEASLFFNLNRPINEGLTYSVTVNGVIYIVTAETESWSGDSYVCLTVPDAFKIIYGESGYFEYFEGYNAAYSPEEFVEDEEGMPAFTPVTIGILQKDDYTVEKWVQQHYQPKGNYVTDELLVEEGLIFPETHIAAENGDGYEWDAAEGVLIKLNSPIVAGETYIMTVDGVSYEVVAMEVNDSIVRLAQVDVDETTFGVWYRSEIYEVYGDYNATYYSDYFERGGYDNEAIVPEPLTLKITMADHGLKLNEKYLPTAVVTDEKLEKRLDTLLDSGGNVDLTGYATEQWVKDQKYLTAVPEGYAKDEDIPTKPEDIGAQPSGNYLTEVPSGYATEEFVKNKIAEAELGGEEVDLSGYAQKSELPTKVSQLQNDSGYLTAVPDGYAKTEDIPKNASDIGAQPEGDYALRSEIPSVPVKSVNGKTGAVSLTAADVKARPDSWMPTASDVGALPSSTVIPTVPTKVSEFTNDAGYLTEHQDLSEYAKKTEIPSVPVKSVNGKTGAVSLTASDVGARPSTWMPSASDVGAMPNTTKIPAKTSDLTNDSGFITGYTETDPTVPAWAKKSTKPSYSKSEVGLGNVDNVKQYSASNPPVVVQDTAPTDTSVVWVDPTDNSDDGFQEAVNAALAQAKASGEFDGKDYVLTNADRAEIAEVLKAEVPLVKVAEQPAFANSVEEMTDPSKVYLMSDGHLYGHMEHQAQPYRFLADDFTVCSIGSYGEISSTSGARVASINTIALDNGTISIACPELYMWIIYFFNDETAGKSSYLGKTAFTAGDIADVSTATIASGTKEGATHCRISLKYASGNAAVDPEVFLSKITIIQKKEGEVYYEWTDTGLTYNQPSDYEDRIAVLETALEGIVNGKY